MVQLRQQVKDASPGFYLTLISIIVSLGFGYLLSKIQPKHLFGNEWSFLYWLKVIASFQAIILTWHEYAMSTVTFKWVLNYLDSLVPFLFGITLFGIIKSINSEELHLWFYFFSGFTFVGLIAYSNQLVKTKREPENKIILGILHKYHPVCISTSFLCTLLFYFFGRLSIKYAGTESVQFLLCIGTNIIFIIYTIWGHFCWGSAFNNNIPSNNNRAPTIS